MTLGHTILFSEMSPPSSLEGQFNAWYDNEHIPLRMAVPGFVSAQRYLAQDDQRNYLAVYEMSARENLQSPEYLVVKNQPSELTKTMLSSVSGFTRYIGNTLGEQWQDGVKDPLSQAEYLYAVFFTVTQEDLPEFDAWYAQDHVPVLLECSDWLGTRRFEIVDGDPQPFNRLAIHYIKTPLALESPARAKARTTPWRDKLAVKPWFKGHYLVFKNHRPRQFSQP
jgi:hypothetical protein